MMSTTHALPEEHPPTGALSYAERDERKRAAAAKLADLHRRAPLGTPLASMTDDEIKGEIKCRIGVAKSEGLYAEGWDSVEANAEVAALFENAKES